MSFIAPRKELSAMIAICFGSMLEWYEVFLYVYWSPIIAQLFFKSSSASMNLINSLLIFMVGFWARPLGGILFGRIGDLFGRKYALILSIVILIFPTLGMGLLPTYEQIGFLAPLCFALLRFLQALPSGGELPGAFCYLYEIAPEKHRHYMTSWGAVGNQIGIAISLIESKLLESLLPPEYLLNWGWRLSFIIGSFIALLGFILRRRLHETPAYQEMIRRHERCKIPLSQILCRYRRKIGQAIALCLFTSACFYTLCVSFPLYISKMLAIKHSGFLSSLGVLLLGTVSLPFFGFLSERFNNKKMLIASTISLMLIIYPLLFTMEHSYTTVFVILLIAFILCLSVPMALLPYRFAALFPTPVRFTGVGIGFNMADGVLGSLITLFSFYLVHTYHSLLPNCFILIACALISLSAFLKLQET